MTIFSYRRNAIFHVLIPLVALLVCAACGRKGPPKPPEDFAPKPVVNPTLQGTVDGLQLGWTIPEPDEPDSEEEMNPPLESFSIQKGEVEVGKKIRLEEIGSVSLRAPEEKFYSFMDTTVEPGKTYQYQILPKNVDGVLGEPGVSLRATFLGENSRIEIIAEKSKRPDLRLYQKRDEDELEEQ